MKRKHLFFVATIFLWLGISGCEPSLPDYIEDYDLVYTTRADTFDFSTVHTYAMPDSVIHDTAIGDDVDRSYDDQILAKLETNLNNLGWTRVTNVLGAKPDVVVLPAISNRQNTSCTWYCWYCYWWWWYGWGWYPYSYSPSTSWYYPTDIICSTYKTGSLYVAMVTPDKVTDGSKLPMVWAGIANGLAEGDNIGQRVISSIDQMFIQSPYLK